MRAGRISDGDFSRVRAQSTILRNRPTEPVRREAGEDRNGVTDEGPDASAPVVIGGCRTDVQEVRARLVDNPFCDELVSCTLLADFWPEVAASRSHVTLDVTDWWALPFGERCVLDAIVRVVRPQVVFEFGTFTGATTTLIADAAPPEARIHTIDIPAEAFSDPEFAATYAAHGGTSGERLGERFRDRPDTRDRIKFHRGWSQDFDPSPLRGLVDLIYVDGSHEYQDVLRDSELAFEMLSPRGVVVWDDYDLFQPGVVRALNELATHLDLTQIASTRFVVHRAPGADGVGGC